MSSEPRTGLSQWQSQGQPRDLQSGANLIGQNVPCEARWSLHRWRSTRRQPRKYPNPSLQHGNVMCFHGILTSCTRYWTGSIPYFSGHIMYAPTATASSLHPLTRSNTYRYAKLLISSPPPLPALTTFSSLNNTHSSSSSPASLGSPA